MKSLYNPQSEIFYIATRAGTQMAQSVFNESTSVDLGGGQYAPSATLCADYVTMALRAIKGLPDTDREIVAEWLTRK